MIGTLIKREILDHLMSLRFAIACILCFIVVLCSIFVRHQDYSQTLAAYHEDSAIEKARHTKMNHPWRVVWQGIRVHSAPNPLKIFVRGVDDDNGHKVELASSREPYFEAAGIGNPLLPLFPSIDMVTFVGIIMSLLAVVFAYDAVCGERERGTLRLMLSYPVPRDTVLLAKWAGGFVTLIIPFMLAVISGVAIMLVQPDVSFTGIQWLQFGGVCLLSIVYVAAIFSAALWISCSTRLSSTSIMILVTLWMVFVLAIPNLSPYLAQTWRPTRALEEFETTRLARDKEIWQTMVHEKMAKYDKEHVFDGEWWRTINWGDWSSRQRVERRRMHELELERQAHLARLRMFKQTDESFMHELNEQIRLSRWIARLSPFSCLAMASTELTDTGLHSKRRLLNQLREHQVILCNYGHDEWLGLHQYEFDHDGKRAPTWHKIQKKPVPPFVYVPASGSDYLGLVLVDAGILVGMVVIFFMLSYMRFLRYDVR